jgi:hypothetical protein
MSFLIGASLLFNRESDGRYLFDMGAFPFIHGRPVGDRTGKRIFFVIGGKTTSKGTE